MMVMMKSCYVLWEREGKIGRLVRVPIGRARLFLCLTRDGVALYRSTGGAIRLREQRIDEGWMGVA